MASIPNGFPISLRSWPSKPSDEVDLPTFFQRINQERGGLINVTEDSLREEIAREEAGHVEDEASEDEEDKGTDQVKARAAAREELLQHISTAHQSAMFQLEFISLLLSKENPASASQSISPHLRERVGLGTMGASKAAKSWTSAEQKADNKLVARGWKATDVNKAIDSILASATRLETEIEKETRYWEELLDLNEQGWNICKVPRRQSQMGVRLGSREVSPVLRSQGLAVISRNDSGSLYLSPDPITADPKVLRIRIQVNGETTGTSPIPNLVHTTAPIQSLLLQTRNTLSALELWHELNRESRTLGSFAITNTGSGITFPLTPSKVAIFDLFSLSDRSQTTSGPDDTLAYALSLALYHLLCNSHRQSLRRRSHPPKPKANPKKANVTEAARNKLPNFLESPTLLRPLLTASNHHVALTSTHTLFHLLAGTLRKASLPFLPTYTIVNIPPNLPAYLTSTERVISALTNHLSTLVTLQITPDTELKVMLRTAMLNLPTTIFTIQLSPETSELSRLCPPPLNTPLLFEQMEAYVLFLSAAAVAQQFITKPTVNDSTGEEKSSNQADHDEWKPTHHPSTLKFSSSSCSSSYGPNASNGTSPRTSSNDKLLTFTLHTLPYHISSSKAPTTTTTTTTNARPSRKGLKLGITYGHDSTFETGGFKGLTDDLALGAVIDEHVSEGESGAPKRRAVTREGKRDGEGWYEWVMWEDDHAAGSSAAPAGDAGKGVVKKEDERAEEEDEVQEVVKSIGDVVAAAVKR